MSEKGWIVEGSEVMELPGNGELGIAECSEYEPAGLLAERGRVMDSWGILSMTVGEFCWGVMDSWGILLDLYMQAGECLPC